MADRHRHRSPLYTETQATAWLSWLAWNMQRHRQTVFLIENLQPTWLSTVRQRWLYALVSRLAIGLTMGIGALTWGPVLPGSPPVAWSYLLYGSVGGIAFGFVDGLRIGRTGDSTPDRAAGARRAGQRRVRPSMVVISTGAMLAAMYQLRVSLGITVGLSLGVLFALMFGLLFGWRNRLPDTLQDIRTVEALTWSPRKALMGALIGLGIGLAGALLLGMVARLILGPDAQFRPMLSFALSNGPMLGLVLGLLAGLQGYIVEGKVFPGQGLRMSARNAVVVGLSVALIGGLSAALSTAFVNHLLDASSAVLSKGLGTGLFLGTVAALWYGGLDLVKHFTVRLILRFTEHAPWNYTRFLDYATHELNFLQKVGSGYVFIHRYLLEHFAARETDQLPQRAAGDAVPTRAITRVGND